MKKKFLKAPGWLIGATTAGLLCGLVVHAQQNRGQATAAGSTTNWVGYLVYGSDVTADAIAHGGPYPTADQKFELGLRNDGTVVWRRAPR